ncbi:hypothetical protein C7M84_014690 [Penaeus vannamei]|uniref:Uncharacterized protein n=1 Tax=Penaeus vannamei TaxID=6689 RepID=A0A423SSS7_PENVA|nr:hypothetical protein C7M84_014690 [Penaeus vannamei]
MGDWMVQFFLPNCLYISPPSLLLSFPGLIDEFLSHPSWQPLSRLTYPLYLVAVVVQLMFIGSVELPLYSNHTSLIIETTGYLFIGGMIALWLSLAVEVPISGLERMLIRRQDKTKEAPKRE